MAVELTCPSCRTIASVSETHAHLDIICPSCHRRFHDGRDGTALGRGSAHASVVIGCPSCHRKYVIPDTNLGHHIVCLWCQHRFQELPIDEPLHEPAVSEEQVIIACPSCGFRRSSTSAYVGQAVGCPQCRALFVVKRQSQTMEVPAPTAWPIVLASGIALLTAGIATTPMFSAVGGILFLFGLGGWISELLPGRGHTHESIGATRASRAKPAERLGTVEHLRPGMAGFRFQLPQKVHPISAGVKGGVLGGLVMPIPAIAYGILSGHGPWFPINLLAGMLLPGIDTLLDDQLAQFNLAYFIVALFIHATFSVGFGLLYGVMLPTLPKFPGSPLFWGGLLMPLVWTGASYAAMGIVNPALRENVDWAWFLLSQFVYGIAMSTVVFRTEQVPAPPVAAGSAVAR